jgi:hypothetical protein
MNTINESPHISTQSNIMASELTIKRKTRNLQGLETSSSAFVKEQKERDSSQFYEKRETDRLNHDLRNPYKDAPKEVEKEVEPMDLTNLELFPTLGNNTDQTTKNISIWNITNHNILTPSTQKTILKKNDEKKVERVHKKKLKKYDSDQESLSDESEKEEEYDENEEENLDIKHMNNLMKKRDFLEIIIEVSKGRLTKSNLQQMQFYNNIKSEYYKLDEEIQNIINIDNVLDDYYGTSNNSLLDEHVEKKKLLEDFETLEKKTKEFLSMLENVDL